MTTRLRQPQPPAWAGKIIGIVVFRDQLVIACESGVFREQGSMLVPIEFKARDEAPPRRKG